MIKTKVPAANVPNNVLEAAALARKLLHGDAQDREDQEQDLTDLLVHRTQLARHMLLLESALDACLANRIADLREEGKFLGLGFATDESPPSQVWFNGLRFQVTMVYLPWCHKPRSGSV